MLSVSNLIIIVRMQYQYYFMKTEVWNQAMEMNVLIYQLCTNIDDKNAFSILNQLRRASLSVPTNIAEGLSKESTKEQLRFLGIAYASLMEVLSLILTMEKLNISLTSNHTKIHSGINNSARIINGYRKYLKKKL